MHKRFGFGGVGVLTLLLLLASCNVSRVVKPLTKGEHQIGGSFGGPAIVFGGAPLPIPFTSVSYAHGLDTGLSVSAALQTTSLLFGIAHFDASLHAELWRSKSDRFGVLASPGSHFFYDFNEGHYRIYPQLDLNAWWHYNKESENLIYGGLGTWVELVREKAHGEVQTHEMMPYVMLGHQFNRPKWSFQVEARYIGMFYDNDAIVVDYLTPFNKGTSGVYLGISRTLGQ